MKITPNISNNNQRYAKISQGVSGYFSGQFNGDMMAGVVVAIMLVPQSMAYAMLAGLPPETGLYAAVAPLFLYAMFGSSPALAVGPVAIVSLMVSAALTPLATPGSKEYVMLALALAALSGIILTLASILKAGRLTNFISHPVIAGFTTAAAIIIGFSQIKHLLGISLERTYFIPSLLLQIFKAVDKIHMLTLSAGLLSIGFLILRGPVETALKARGLSDGLSGFLAKSLPFALVIISTVSVYFFQKSAPSGLKIIGTIPQGLPPLTNPGLDWPVFMQLLQAAGLISLVGFVESLAVAKSLAAKKRQKISPNQELLGLGMANFAAGFTGGYPVTGGFSRSIVNFSAGANSKMAAVITAVLVSLFLLFLAPALYYLPKAVLAAIILVAVFQLLDFKSFFSSWRYNKPDGLAYAATFVTVLGFGVEMGLLAGVLLSIGMYLWKTSVPHYAILGRVGTSEHFRNIARHSVTPSDEVLIIRVDENLYFANTAYLETSLLAEIADRPKIRHLILSFSAVSYVDSSAVETLESLVLGLKEARVIVHLSEIKGPVMDQLANTAFLDHLTPGRIFLNVHEAMTLLLEPENDPQAHMKLSGAGPSAGENLWHDVRNSNEPERLEKFITAFPSSRYAGQARKKLATLNDEIAYQKAIAAPSETKLSAYLKTAPANSPNINKAWWAKQELKYNVKKDAVIGITGATLVAGLAGAVMMVSTSGRFKPQDNLKKDTVVVTDQAKAEPKNPEPTKLAVPTKLKSASPKEIKELQQRLKNRGFEPGSIDGQPGGKTQSAAIKLLDQLKPDGEGPDYARLLAILRLLENKDPH